MRQIAAVLLLASSQSLASGSCPVVERALIGSWSSASEDGFFEQFTLSTSANSRTFDSWLHERPEISGATWSFKECELVVAPKNGGLAPFRFKVVSLKQGHLRLLDTADQTISVYRRVRAEP